MIGLLLFALGSQCTTSLAPGGIEMRSSRVLRTPVIMRALTPRHQTGTTRLTKTKERQLSETIQSSLAILSSAAKLQQESVATNGSRTKSGPNILSPSFAVLAETLRLGTNPAASFRSESAVPSNSSSSSTSAPEAPPTEYLEAVLREGLQARDALVVANLGLVHSAVRRQTRGGHLISADLAQEATLGLLRAAEKFDPSKFGTGFATYATPWVRSSLSEGVRKEQSLVRVPMAKNNLFKAVDKYRSEAMLRDYHHEAPPPAPGPSSSSPAASSASDVSGGTGNIAGDEWQSTVVEDEEEGRVQRGAGTQPLSPRRSRDPRSDYSPELTELAAAIGVSPKAAKELLLRQPLRRVVGGTWPLDANTGLERSDLAADTAAASTGSAPSTSSGSGSGFAGGDSGAGGGLVSGGFGVADGSSSFYSSASAAPVVVEFPLASAVPAAVAAKAKEAARATAPPPPPPMGVKRQQGGKPSSTHHHQHQHQQHQQQQHHHQQPSEVARRSYAAYASPEMALSAQDLSVILEALLTPEEFLAVTTRFSLPYGGARRLKHGQQLRSYPEVARATNRSPVQVAQAVRSSLAKLRQPDALEKLRPFLGEF